MVRVCFKVKKQGVWWTFGEIAHYDLKTKRHLVNKPLLESLKGTTKKVRIMIPPENFSALP